LRRERRFLVKKSKKQKWKKKLRNAAPPSSPATRGSWRPRVSRSHGGAESSFQRLAYTAAGAVGSALVGAMLAKENWAPKTIAGALATLGAGLTWKGDSATIKSLGSGAMSSAGGQLVLLLIDEHGKKPANADELPAGALEGALERARARLAMTAGQTA
jgi:hypothetical protein